MRKPFLSYILPACLAAVALLLSSCAFPPNGAVSPPPDETIAPSVPGAPEPPKDTRIPVTVPVFHPTIASGAYAYGAIQAGGYLSLWGDTQYLWYEGLVEETGGVYDSTLRQITAVWMSQWAGLALDEYARLWAFGSHWWGHQGPEGSFESGPVLMLENVVTADVGLRHCIALTEDGSVWIWGMSSLYDRTATAPMQIASNAIGVMTGYTDHAYILSRDATLFDAGSLYDLIAGAAPSPVAVLENVRQARDGLLITTDSTLYMLGPDGVPQQIMTGVVSAQNDMGGTLALCAGGGLYYWNEQGMAEETPEDADLPPYVPYTAPVKLMDGVACALAGWQTLYVQMENEWSLRALDYAQVRGVAAGGPRPTPDSLPVFMEGVRSARRAPAAATLSLPASWDGSVAAVPPVLFDHGEPPLDAYARAAAVPDFLDDAQQQLYRRALCLYLHTFGGETSSIERFPLSPGDAPDPPDDAREYLALNNTRYLFARGRYRDWALFDTAVRSVFTDAFWTWRNEINGVPLFTEYDGSLVYIDASLGNSYYNENFPDEFELLEKTDDSIRFTVIGHYSEPYPKPGETYAARDARLAREYEFTVALPIELVRTEDGWRFSRFYAAIADEEAAQRGLLDFPG